MSENIKDYWPIPEFDIRDNQEKALEWMQEQLETVDAKYIILELPVGSGKSLLGLNLSKYLGKGLGSSFVLTPQRILQDQYEEDFKQLGTKFLASLHGKANYKCKSKGASCNIGSMLKPACTDCPFKQAKEQAQRAHNTVLNYKLALTSFHYTETFSKRKLMIMDEAHTLEQHLVDFDSVDITYARCKKYDIKFVKQTDIGSAIQWITEEYIPVVQDILNDLEADCEEIYEKLPADVTRKDLSKIRETEELAAHVTDVLDISIRDMDYILQKYVLVYDKTMFQFKRISGAYSFHRIIKPMADKFLFMSSTILNKHTFCYDLGIDVNEAAFLSLPSEFAPENRPIYYLPVMKMNASWNKPEQAADRQKMIQRVIDLLEIHKDESGILHTANYQVAEWLVENLDGKINHMIYHHNPKSDMNRGEAINGFMESALPSILISPSITEGLDLKDDLARFAMIVKVPFGYLGDQWIKRRLDMSEEWYRRRAITDIIQGGGRIVRGSDDEGTVYILDASFAYLYHKSISMVPDWWKESYKVV
jgi:Rad3-related DNA helicase